MLKTTTRFKKVFLKKIKIFFSKLDFKASFSIASFYHSLVYLKKINRRKTNHIILFTFQNFESLKKNFTIIFQRKLKAFTK